MPNNLRTIREGKGLSQESLAQTLEVDRRTVWRWENDHIVIPEEQLKKLARFFEVAAIDIDPQRINLLLTKEPTSV